MTGPHSDFRILVTGARSVSERGAALVRIKLVTATADAIAANRGVVIMQGECPYGGVDKVAETWAEQTPGVVNEGHPARWSRSGALLGPQRNAEMVAAGADICLAFPDSASRGTWDCIRKAANASIPVRIYPLGERGAR